MNLKRRNMPNHLEFLVGQQYENRKGVYTVLEVQGTAMRIRWKDGEEVETTVIMQSRIIQRMQREMGEITSNGINTPHIKKVKMAKGWRHRIIR